MLYMPSARVMGSVKGCVALTLVEAPWSTLAGSRAWHLCRKQECHWKVWSAVWEEDQSCGSCVTISPISLWLCHFRGCIVPSKLILELNLSVSIYSVAFYLDNRNVDIFMLFMKHFQYVLHSFDNVMGNFNPQAPCSARLLKEWNYFYIQPLSAPLY